MISTEKVRITLIALLSPQMMTFGQTAIPLVYDRECVNDNLRVPGTLAVDKSSEIATLPDPFAWTDGSGRSADFKDWECCRFEIVRQLQYYELGMKPVVPKGSIETTLINDTLRVVTHENGEALLLTALIKHPEGNDPFPAIVGIGRSTGSLPVQLFNKRRIA